MTATESLLCLSAIGIYAGTAVMLARRRSPGRLAAIIPAGLAIYLPLRALLIGHGVIDENNGLNVRVGMALPDALGTVSRVVFISAVAFWVGTVLLRRVTPRVRTPHLKGAREWTRIVPWLYLISLPGVVVQGISSLSIVSSDYEVGSGIVQQFLLLLYFLNCLSIALAIGLAERLGPAIAVMVGIVLVVAVLSASKDTLITVVLAVAAGLLLRRRVESDHRRYLAAIAAGTAVVLLVVFPVVQAYRIGIEVEGLSLQESLTSVPRILSSYDIASGKPSGDSQNVIAASVSQGLLYFSNRFHGADSLALLVEGGPSASLLPLSSLVAAPFSVVLPTSFLDGGGEPVGRLFAVEYWGSSATSTTHVAVGAFGQVFVSLGWLGLIAVAMLWGLITALAGRLLSSDSVTRFACGLALLLTSIGFERDLTSTTATALRRLALVGLLYLVFVRGARKRSAAGL